MTDFPFYHQHDSMDCGAACIRMIARHYGRYYSLEYLRELTYIDREGVSISSISDAAEHIGFHTLAINTNYEELYDNVPLPCIAYWNQQHFVVVYRVTKSYVWIADPEHGRISLTKEEFLEGWTSNDDTGILLLFEPTPDFSKRDGDEVNKSGFSYLWSYFRRYKRLIRQLVLGLIFTSIIQLMFPFLMILVKMRPRSRYSLHLHDPACTGRALSQLRLCRRNSVVDFTAYRCADKHQYGF